VFHDKHRTTWRRAPQRDDGVTAAARPAMLCDDAIEDLLRTLRDERGFAFATLQNHLRSLRPFLAWQAERARPWAETTLEDVSAYLASRPRWSRATIAFHVQSLRTLFRHTATRGWCRPGFAETIEAPRLYTHERLPQG
jgi:integrase/recombinase XerD